MKRRIAALLLASLGFVAGVTAVASGQQYQYPVSATNPTAVGGCVIRFDQLSDTGNTVVPYALENAGHINVGCPEVRVDWSNDGVGRIGDLIVEQPGPGNVISMVCSPDETLAEKRITCGNSGGGGITRVRFFDSAGNFIPASDKAKLYDSLANAWLMWVRWDGQ